MMSRYFYVIGHHTSIRSDWCKCGAYQKWLNTCMSSHCRYNFFSQLETKFQEQDFAINAVVTITAPSNSAQLRFKIESRGSKDDSLFIGKQYISEYEGVFLVSLLDLPVLIHPNPPVR